MDLLAGLSREQRRQVVGEAVRLLNLVSTTKGVREAEAARRELLPERGPEVKKQRLYICKNPLAAMLMARPDTSRPRVTDLDILRGWALVGALRFCKTYKQADTYSRVDQGLRTVRHLVGKGYSFDLMLDLPPFGTDLESLIAALRGLEKTLHVRGADEYARVVELSRLIANAVYPRFPAYRKDAQRGPYDDRTPDLVIEDDGAREVVFEHVGKDAEAPSEELIEDRELLYYRFPDLVAPERRDVYLAEQQLNLFEEEQAELGWTGDFASLSNLETCAIWRAAWAEKDTDIGAVWALAYLLFGREVSGLGQRPRIGESWWNNGGIAFVPDVAHQTDRTAPDTVFTLQPPNDLAALFEQLSDRHSGHEDVQAWLKKQNLERAVGPSHLIRALRDAMPNEDRAIVGLLTGRKVGDVVQMHYTKVKTKRLASAWRKALRDRFETDIAVEVMSPAAMIGTLKSPSRQQVRRYFKRLVDETRMAGPDQDDVQTFAGLTNLFGAVLNFLTARRPNGAAFEPFERIVGDHRPRILLTGKGGRLVNDDRWVPLCPTAHAVILHWRGICADMSHRLFMLPHVRDSLSAVVEGQGVPFLKWSTLMEEPTPLSAPELWGRAGTPAKRGPAKATNWARHYVRSALVELDVPGPLIDGFMGHGGHMFDPLTPTSASSIADQDRLRHALEQIWCDLEVELPGLGR